MTPQHALFFLSWNFAFVGEVLTKTHSLSRYFLPAVVSLGSPIVSKHLCSWRSDCRASSRASFVKSAFHTSPTNFIRRKPFQMSSHNNNSGDGGGKRSAKPTGGRPSKVSRSTGAHPANHSSLVGESGGDGMSVDEADTTTEMKLDAEMNGLEILEEPIKSHSDKKSYRFVDFTSFF